MKLWMVVLCAPLLSISQNCIAAIGTITDQANAPPSIQRKKEMIRGQKGTSLQMMDTIRTQQGKVGITFEDKTKVQLTENSRLVIDDFVYDPKKGSGKLAVKVAMGTVRYASGQIAKNSPQSIAVNTPSATISVRGTDFTATVDELGRSTIILLPSCPADYKDIERDCKTGMIWVESDEGRVVLDQPFQATEVDSRDSKPLKPVIVSLTEDAISNMLIVSPPKELREDKNEKLSLNKSALDVDFLAAQGLINVLDKEEKEQYQDRLSKNFLDSDFLANVLDLVNAQLAAQLDLLGRTKSGLLPDYNATTGVTAFVDDLVVELCRDNGSDVMCVSTPKNQNSTVYMTQGAVEVKNRINSGNGTTITLIQK